MNLVQKNESINDKTTDLNPFKISQSNLNNLNPFIQNNKDNNIQNHAFIGDNNTKIINPFQNNNDKTNNNNNPFINNNDKTNNNPFLNNNNETNNGQTKNPFLIKDSSNVFTFDSNNIKNVIKLK